MDIELYSFSVGFLCGVVYAVVFWIFSSSSYENYLQRKAASKFRTAVCIKGKFYYIIPEHEYVHEYRRIYDELN